MSRQPLLFLAHGNPMNALEENRFTRDWQRLAVHPERPQAIVVISAHWCTHGLAVCNASWPQTIHDFSGFPQELFNQQYPAPGSPELADRIADLLPHCVQTPQWGLDHGTWGVLVHVFPNADIPVVQVSIPSDHNPRHLFELGRALRPLRDDGVMIVGSGNIVHNIRRWMMDPNGPADWAKDFDSAVWHALETRDHDRLLNYREWPMDTFEPVPTSEHLDPLFYLLGASYDDEPLRSTQYPGDTLEEIGMRSLRWG